MSGQHTKFLILTHVIAFAAGAGAFWIGTTGAPQKAKPLPTATAMPAVTAPKIPAIPVPLPALSRPAILAATAQAADATASGKALPKANLALVGRSFVVRLPFGCKGQMEQETQDWAGWRFDPKTMALRLTARLTRFEGDEWVKAIAGDMAFDGVEGVWIRRPWTSAESCPKQNADSASSQDEQTVALAQFFSPTSSRTLRRGDRPYASTQKLDGDQVPSADGYILELRGRMAAFADGQPIHCQQEAPSVRPRCMISVQFENVSFMSPGNDEPIVEWH